MATNDSSLSQDLAQLGHQARQAGQRLGLAAEDAVPGDPPAAAAAAEQLAQIGHGCTEVADALARVETGDWRGPAGQAFRSHYAQHTPRLLHAAGEAFTHAGTALSHYAQTLAEQQTRGQHAVEALGRAAAESQQARQAHNTQVAAANTATPGAAAPPAFVDPAAAAHAAAAHELDAARTAVAQAGDQAAQAIQQAAAQAPAGLGSSVGAEVGAAAATVGQTAAGAGDLVVDAAKAAGTGIVAAAGLVHPELGWMAPQVGGAQSVVADTAAGAAQTVGQAGTVAAGTLQEPLLRWTAPAAARQLDHQVTAAATDLWRTTKGGLDLDQWHHNTARAAGAAAPALVGAGVGAAARTVHISAETGTGAQAAAGVQTADRVEQAAGQVPRSSVNQPPERGLFPHETNTLQDNPTSPAHPGPGPGPQAAEPGHPPAGPAEHAPAEHGGLADGAANSDQPAPAAPHPSAPEAPAPAPDPPVHGGRPEAHPLPHQFAPEDRARALSNLAEARRNWDTAFQAGDDPAMRRIDDEIAGMERDLRGRR